MARTIPDTLIDMAKWCATLERWYGPSESPEKMYEISMALLETIDYAIITGVITEESDRFPPEVEKILERVYQYMGDPLD